MQQVSARVPSTRSERNRRLALLLLLMAAAMIIYYPRASHNLPVAANVDDRTSLSVLLRFHQGSANPRFFMYPTLYYYLTYAFTAPFGFARILLTGHLLNLSLVGVTAWLSYLFCVRHFGSRGAGIVASVAVLFSPLLISSGAYLCTDVLLAALTLLSVDRLITYFETRASQDWLFAMIAVGCAIATKYTAALIFVTYFLIEVLQTFRRRNDSVIASPETARDYFSLRTLTVALIVVALLCGLAAVFFPVNAILHFVTMHRVNTEARSMQEYLTFLSRLRRLAIELCLGSLLLVALIRNSRTAYLCVAWKRPYLGVLIVLGIFILTTPFSLLDPGKFVYDIGALLRSNVVVAGAHQQWGPYWHWLVDSENKIVVLLGLLGLGWIAYRATWRFLSATLFLALYVLTICSSHLGVARYLEPALPLLYCAAGFFFMELWRGLPGLVSIKPNPTWCKGVVGLLGILVCAAMIRTTARNNAAAAQHDAFFASYGQVLHEGARYQVRNGPAGARTVLYAGYAPSVELALAGFQTLPISWAALQGSPLGEHIACNDLLILNAREARANHIAAESDDSVHLLLDDPQGPGGSAGQIVARRRDCP